MDENRLIRSEPPEQSRQYSGSLIDTALELRHWPNESFLVKEYKHSSGASVTAHRIRNSTPNWPSGHWKLVARAWEGGSRLWITFLGESEDGNAYFEAPAKPGRVPGGVYKKPRELMGEGSRFGEKRKNAKFNKYAEDDGPGPEVIVRRDES